MTVRLSDNQLDQLCQFVGYGSPLAPVWFVGMEENGAEPEHLLKRLRFQRFEDLQKAHLEYLNIDRHHNGRIELQSTWNRMCELMILLHGNVPSVAAKKSYQASYLGRSGGSSLLLELMPLPFPNYSSFLYEDVNRRFGDKGAYRREIRPQRIDMLQRLFAYAKTEAEQPRLVVCYGANDWKVFKKVFPNAAFEPRPKFVNKWNLELARYENSLILLTPHLYLLPMSYMWRISEIIFGQLSGFPLPLPELEANTRLGFDQTPFLGPQV